MMPKIKKAKITRKTVSHCQEFSAFRLFKAEKTNELAAAHSRNCDCKDGILTGGVGLTVYQPSDGSALAATPNLALRNIYLLPTMDEQGKKEWELFLVSKQNSTYAYSKTDKTFARILEDVPVYTMFTAWDAVGGTSLFVGTEINLGVSKNKGGSFAGVTATDGQACVFKNRVFAADGNNLHYSAPSNTADFSESLESGTLYGDVTDGEIQGLAVWKDALYVFAENGVRKITASGSPTQFTMD